MKRTSTTLSVLALGVGLAFSGNNCQAQQRSGALIPNLAPARSIAQPGRYPIIARGPERAIIQSTPIELRPNRPLHFYGNVVRRSYNGQAIVPFVNRF